VQRRASTPPLPRSKPASRRGRPALGDRKRVRTCFTLSPDELRWLQAAAREKNQSLSEALSDALRVSRSHRPTRARIAYDAREIAGFCAKHGIQRLSLFGSVLTDRFSAESDVDVLVELKPGKAVGFFELSELAERLGKLLGGRRIDLKTMNELSPYFREEVLREAEVVYAA
jgi:predicted nucleotidyltransferase